jgi:hypothetical protein
LGNPAIRVTGLEMADAEVHRIREGRYRVIVPRAPVGEDGAVLLRVPMDDFGDAPYVFVKRPDEHTWCSGIWYPGSDGSCLYLWIRMSSPSEGQALAEAGDSAAAYFELEVTQQDPTEMVRRAVESALVQVPYWAISIDEPNAADLKTPGTTPAASRAEECVALIRALSSAARAVMPARGVVIDSEAVRRLCADVWSQLGFMAERLLGWLVELTLAHGSLHIDRWENNFLRVGTIEAESRCTCGNTARGQTYQFPNRTALMRVNYQCPSCGPIGEDDASGYVSLVSMSTAAIQGGCIRMRISVVGPAEQLLTVRAVGLLESPFRSRTMLSELVRELVQPGAARQIELTLSVPEDLTPGSYPCAVLVVANGSASTFRRMAQIDASAPRPAESSYARGHEES